MLANLKGEGMGLVIEKSDEHDVVDTYCLLMILEIYPIS